MAKRGSGRLNNPFDAPPNKSFRADWPIRMQRDDVVRLISAREVTATERKPMKKVESELEDGLRPEYDLRSPRVRKLGPGRKSFADVVRL